MEDKILTLFVNEEETPGEETSGEEPTE